MHGAGVAVTLLLSRPDVQIHHADWRGLAAVLPRREDGTVADLLCVDAPYSSTTHAGHDGAVESTRFRPEDEKRIRVDRRNGARYAVGVNRRRTISYAAWDADDVAAFVGTWAPIVRGWMVSITDDVLAPVWRAAFNGAGLYAFAPLPFVASGSTVRLVGDGPPSWTCWVVVARPRREPFSKWYRHHRGVPGAYVLPPGYSEEKLVVGGKPLWLGERLVEDYSRPGDIVVDPCCGAATFPLAASRCGRIGIGGDVSAEHAAIAAERCGWMRQVGLFAGVGT